MRKISSLVVMLVLCTTLALAQNRVVSGQVTDEKGDPIAFASVKVKNGKGGVAADANGNFKIEVKNGAVLIISAAGSVDREITVDANTNFNVTLAKSNNELSTVVVSALGVKRSAKSTTYAAQQISGERLTQTRETDLTTTLAGKVAGLQVLGQAGSKLGDAGRIRLRGVSSLTEKGALFVVDGTILTNVTDINTDDIASVNVLKGPAATALYGQRAEGGVILISLKKGKKNSALGVELNATGSADVVGMLPQYQNDFGGGTDNVWKTFKYTPGVHPAEWAAFDGKRYPEMTDDASWGPKFDDQPYIPWYGWYGGKDGKTFSTASWSPQKNNIRDFYATGSSINTNVSLSKGGKWYTVRAGYNLISKKGILPYSTQDKHLFTTQTTFDITSKWTAGFNLNYSNEKIKGDFGDDYSNQTSGSFNQWFHRDLDMNMMRDLVNLKTQKGYYASWNMAGNPAANSNSDAYYRGNYWTNHYTWLKNYSEVQKRNRFYGDVNMAYKLTKDLKISAAYRFNLRNTDTEKKMPFDLARATAQSTDYDVPRGTAPFPTSYAFYNFYKQTETKYYENNIELIGSYNKTFGDWNIDALLGGNYLEWKTEDSTRMTSFGLKQQDVYSFDNSVGSVYRQGTFLSRKKVYSAFAKATIGFKDFLFIDLAGRQDFSSVLPNNSNGYFYPSVGGSLIFTEFMKNKPSSLSFGKIRASWAQVGTDNLNPYAINPTYFVQPITFNGNPLTSVPNGIIDPNIKPTLNTAFEIGADLRFFRDRVGVSFTYFKEDKKDDIVQTAISSASGYTTLTFNAGSVTRDGYEVELNFKPIRSKNFNWDMSLNWSYINVLVKKISDNQDFIAQFGGDAFGQTAVYHYAGQEWGQLQGYGIQRINGVPVINNDGTYAINPEKNFGTVLPRYTGGLFNSVTFKNWTLSASLDYSYGGKFYSLSNAFGTYSGLMYNTSQLNDNGVNIREPVANGGGVHVFGVDEAGKPKDMYMEAFDYFHQNFGSGLAELDIFDGSFVKMREITLGYNFDVKKLGSWAKSFKKLGFSLFARNPFNIYTANPHFDPSELSGGYVENGQLPGIRSYGGTLRLGF
ncbi:MAG: SusC/RagA family TonB-linked outer membrane protein [Bacteroidota bacterium]